MLVSLVVAGTYLSRLLTSIQLTSWSPDNIGLVFSRQDLDPSQCSCPDTRSVLDIIWSCLGTIFLCTWVAIHPNLPSAEGFAYRALFGRLKLMFTALIAPEIVVFLSVRQWLAAREISRQHKDQGWTMTHAHFLIMGGFVLMKGDEDMGTLTCELFQELVASDELTFPTITKEDIEE
uniref:Uncharacterized protein n=2 Tax=Psilocybe cubensis TaxID=181762 RepID=A0A8H7YBI4_PSICU